MCVPKFYWYRPDGCGSCCARCPAWPMSCEGSERSIRAGEVGRSRMWANEPRLRTVQFLRHLWQTRIKKRRAKKGLTEMRNGRSYGSGFRDSQRHIPILGPHRYGYGRSTIGLDPVEGAFGTSLAASPVGCSGLNAHSTRSRRQKSVAAEFQSTCFGGLSSHLGEVPGLSPSADLMAFKRPHCVGDTPMWKLGSCRQSIGHAGATRFRRPLAGTAGDCAGRLQRLLIAIATNMSETLRG